MKAEFPDFVSIQLTRGASEPLYVQLYEALRTLITDGKLSHGYLLPPVRKFASSLNVNAGTVMSSYKMLERNGYIFSRAGSGSYVADITPAPEAPSLDEIIENIPGLTEPLQSAGSATAINLAGASLNPDLISVDAFKQVLIEVLERDRGRAFDYQESQGFFPLREAVALHLKMRGVQTEPDDLQIISGAQQGIDIVSRALLNYGDYVFTENPTYPGAIAAFRSRGAKIVEINMQPDGIALEALEENLKKFRPKLLYVMPNIQNPTGYSYTSARKNRLMGLARYYGAVLLEDDYIGELDYGQTISTPLKAADRDDRVIYLKSFSKIFMPGLRLAFLTMPKPFKNKLLSIKHNSDISTSGLTQRAFDLYLRKGFWHTHILELRERYQRLCAETLTALAASMPADVQYTQPSGGLSIWLRLPDGVSARKIVCQAQEHEILVAEGSAFFPRQAPDSYLRISFATVSAEQIHRGVATLGALIRKDAAR